MLPYNNNNVNLVHNICVYYSYAISLARSGKIIYFGGELPG